MPTVIDSLVVTLGLDAKQFTDGQKQAVESLRQMEGAAQKHGTNATRHVNELVGAFKELQGRLLAIGALIAAGLGFNRITQEVTKATTELGYMAKTLDMSAQNLDAWQKLGRTVGATAEEMSSSLGAVNAQLQEFRATGTSQLAALMGTFDPKYGVRKMQTTDTPDQIMMRLSQWYVQQPDKGQAAHLLRTRGGLSQGAINLLGLGPQELQKQLDAMKKLAPTEEDIAKFTKLTKAFGELLAVIDRLTQQALLPFVSALTKILNMLTDWLSKWATSNQNPAEAAGEGLSRMGYPELKPNPSQPSLGSRLWSGTKSFLGGDGFGKGFYGRGSEAPAGAAPGGAAPSAPGAVSPGGALSGTLAEQRSRFAQELAANPALRDKVMRIAANEQGSHPEGTQSVIESMMNRALVRGTNLETQARWYRAERGGYYEMGNMGRGALENPRQRAILEQGLTNALAGSNVANYATDNSSGALAFNERASGKFRYRQGYHGETFFAPGWGEPGLARAWDRWHDSVVAGESSGKATSGTPRLRVDRSPFNPESPSAGANRSFELWQGLGLGAKGALQRGGDNDNSTTTNSNTTNIHSMNVTVPPGADPTAYGDGIMRRLSDYNNVQNANTGMV